MSQQTYQTERSKSIGKSSDAPAASTIPHQNNFQRLNALVDRWASVLKPTEFAIAVVYLRHADRDGVAWPGAGTIAEYLQTDVRNVRRARQSLVARGLLEPIDISGGAESGKYRLRLDRTPQGEIYPEGKNNPEGENDADPGRNSPCPPGSNLPADPGLNLPPEHLIEQTNEPTTNRAGVGSESKGGEREEAIRYLLSMEGVHNGTAAKLLGRPDLQPVHILIFKDKPEVIGADSPPGMLVRLLQTHPMPRVIPLMDVHRLAKAGAITGVDGKRLGGGLKYSHHHLILPDGSDIHESKLLAERISVAFCAERQECNT
jgi:hypothetical protein